VHANKGSYADMYQRDIEASLSRIKERIKELDNLMDEIEEQL
jgi:tetrahydromethanopterin S-methyltransferase subunit B